MKKYKILDAFCKAGGAGVGYNRAGFEVVGIDIEYQPNYPFKFIQTDAIEFIQKYGNEFDAIHASPPCQKFSCSTALYRNNGKIYPDLISATRAAMILQNKPGIIENVPTAPIRPDLSLYGNMFDLKVIRKRNFELINWFMMQPGKPKIIGTVKAGDYVSVYGNGHFKDKKTSSYPKFKKENVLATWSYAMDIDWMTKTKELSEAIPPAYTEYIGEYLINHLNYIK